MSTPATQPVVHHWHLPTIQFPLWVEVIFWIGLWLIIGTILVGLVTRFSDGGTTNDGLGETIMAILWPMHLVFLIGYVVWLPFKHLYRLVAGER